MKHQIWNIFSHLSHDENAFIQLNIYIRGMFSNYGWPAKGYPLSMYKTDSRGWKSPRKFDSLVKAVSPALRVRSSSGWSGRWRWPASEKPSRQVASCVEEGAKPEGTCPQCSRVHCLRRSPPNQPSTVVIKLCNFDFVCGLLYINSEAFQGREKSFVHFWNNENTSYNSGVIDKNVRWDSVHWWILELLLFHVNSMAEVEMKCYANNSAPMEQIFWRENIHSF